MRFWSLPSCLDGREFGRTDTCICVAVSPSLFTWNYTTLCVNWLYYITNEKLKQLKKKNQLWVTCSFIGQRFTGIWTLLSARLSHARGWPYSEEVRLWFKSFLAFSLHDPGSEWGGFLGEAKIEGSVRVIRWRCTLMVQGAFRAKSQYYTVWG